MMMETTIKGKKMKKHNKMSTVTANNRVATGDMVSWISKSGTAYSGVVVSIKVGPADDLIIVRLADGQHRSFYDNATDWNTIQG